LTKHRTSSRARRPAAGAVEGLPIVAIVGRPNVGKSTLFNRLARRRQAIVHDEPGVTRDRHYAETTALGKRYLLVDTGGYDPDDEDPMKVGIAAHVRAAVAESDAIVFVTDARTPLGEADRATVELLRRSGKPVFYAANKADSPGADAEAFELYRLGVDRVYAVSALHGRGVGDLEADVVGALSDDDAKTSPAAGDATRVALIGRPNAGKSSLLNRILGTDRALVDARPGTTRDPIDALVERGGRPYILVDTAGIRRKSKVAKEGNAVESLSVLSTIRSIERAQVVVVVCDASEGASEQDAKILGLAEERGRAVVIALNKVDLTLRAGLSKTEEGARDKLAFVQYATVVRTSAKTGRGLGELFDAIDQAHASFYKRVTTGELNRFFKDVLETRPPPTMGNRAPRIYYVTQAAVAPPTFVAMTNAPDSIHFSYQRFVVNQLRKQFGFEGSPVRVIYKPRRRRDLKQEAQSRVR
jgi:GTP-binding protein